MRWIDEMDRLDEEMRWIDEMDRLDG